MAITEEEWLRRSQPKRMLDYLRDAASIRKMRLFSYATCFRVWESMTDPRSRHAVEMVEASADRLVSEEMLAEAKNEAEAACIVGDDPHAIALRTAFAAAYDSPFAVNHLVQGKGTNSRKKQAAIIFEIFGNPFRPVSFEPAWRTSDVMLLAKGIYDERAFDRMPILADALQDAECTSDDILNHLRDPHATHVRGCWALDLVLGKS